MRFIQSHELVHFNHRSTRPQTFYIFILRLSARTLSGLVGEVDFSHKVYTQLLERMTSDHWFYRFYKVLSTKPWIEVFCKKMWQKRTFIGFRTTDILTSFLFIFVHCLEVLFFMNNYFLVCIFKYRTSTHIFSLKILF